MTRAQWLGEQDRRRSLVAWGWTAGIYALALLAAWGLGLLHPSELAEAPGVVVVDLGPEEGPPGGAPLGLESAPERPERAPSVPAPAPAAAPAQAPMPAPSAAPPVAAAKPEVSPNAPAAAPAPNAEAAPPVAALPSPQAEPAPPPTPAPPRSFGSAPRPASAAGSAPAVGSGSVVYRGTEKGNALDTSFGASSGTVGRSLYAPIYGYMPLPERVGAAVYEAIPSDKDGYFSADSRKKTFRQFYQAEGDQWSLKAPVPLERRPALWFMLEDAGYDLGTADYKASLKTSSVVIEFAIGPAAGGAKASLIDLAVVSSSGSPEIDEAVVYGFRQASYFNKNAFAVSGKFTYRFGK